MKISLSILLSISCFVCNPRGRVLPSTVLKEPVACYVVFFTPGPAWIAHPVTIKQEGHTAHIRYTDSMMRRGYKAIGGSLANNEGSAAVWFNKTYEEVKQLVDNDPSIRSGIYKAEIKEWMIGISNINYTK